MNGCEFIRVVTRNDEECFLLTKLRNGGKQGFELTVCHDGHAWTGEVSKDDLDELSTRLKMVFDKYVKQTVEALTCISESGDTFQYTLKKQKDKADFVWKKHVPSEDITFQLGSVTLKARTDSTQFITLMFQHCIQSMQELKERIHSLETDNERLSQERINALKRLEKCVVAKEELEHEVYSKFSMVLNSKKEKIRQLKKQVEEGVTVDDTGDVSDESHSGTMNLKRSRVPQTISQTKGDSEMDTDEETPKSKRQRSRQSQKPGTSKQSSVTLGDESLDLGHDDENTAAVSRPKRQRGRPQKKQTPSKPVLPRVGSNESTPGSERKSRLRKTGSSSSNRSCDNIDAEDLMGEL